MRNIIGAAFVSLDGVMQAPGGPSEDWTGGFKHGDWLPALGDDSTFDTIDRLFNAYDIFAAYSPIKRARANRWDSR